uniref:Follitropin subunit beta n=1 Tax=Prolemur simus TaxID=1328070 RepID=A0A8C8ZTI5_PROSS
MKTEIEVILLQTKESICSNNCELTNIIIAVEKEESHFYISINTAWCARYCYTQDLVYKDPELVYETVRLPGCAHHTDSLYTYPVATKYHCGKCDRNSTNCTMSGLGPSYCSFSEMKK